MKKFLTIIIAFTFTSCFMLKKNGIEMKIENNSQTPITNIEFQTTEKTKVIKIDTIAPNQSVTKFLSMKSNKTDGGYLLSFYRFNKKETIKAGYYSNGSSFNDWIHYKIENDTVLVKIENSKY